MAGAAGAAVHDGVLVPCDVVKQRLQLGCYNGVVDCITSMARAEGLVGFYRSFPVTLLQNVPQTAVLA